MSNLMQKMTKNDLPLELAFPAKPGIDIKPSIGFYKDEYVLTDADLELDFKGFIEFPEYALTDKDLIREIKEMDEFSALIPKPRKTDKSLWNTSGYVENRVNKAASYATNLRANSNLASRWAPSKHTVRLSRDYKNTEKLEKSYNPKSNKSLIQRIISWAF
jgi:hypothetical protein